jgi:hypothetical protein
MVHFCEGLSVFDVMGLIFKTIYTIHGTLV